MSIDAHVHLPTAPELDTRQKQKRRLLAEMRENGVEKCLLIADSWQQSDIGNNQECLALFADTPEVSVAAGVSPLVDFDRQCRALAAWLKEGRVSGIKLYPGHEDFPLTDPALERVYLLAQRYAVPVLFHSSGGRFPGRGTPEEAAAVLQRHPGLTLVCCHCFAPHVESCLPLLRYPNLYFDISSLADTPRLAEQAGRPLLELLRRAPDRVMFGSDYAACSQREHLRFARSLPLDGAAMQALLGLTARRLYRM